MLSSCIPPGRSADHGNWLDGDVVAILLPCPRLRETYAAISCLCCRSGAAPTRFVSTIASWPQAFSSATSALAERGVRELPVAGAVAEPRRCAARSCGDARRPAMPVRLSSCTPSLLDPEPLDERACARRDEHQVGASTVSPSPKWHGELRAVVFDLRALVCATAAAMPRFANCVASSFAASAVPPADQRVEHTR